MVGPVNQSWFSDVQLLLSCTKYRVWPVYVIAAGPQAFATENRVTWRLMSENLLLAFITSTFPIITFTGQSRAKRTRKSGRLLQNICCVLCHHRRHSICVKKRAINMNFNFLFSSMHLIGITFYPFNNKSSKKNKNISSSLILTTWFAPHDWDHISLVDIFGGVTVPAGSLREGGKYGCPGFILWSHTGDQL